MTLSLNTLARTFLAALPLAPLLLFTSLPLQAAERPRLAVLTDIGGDPDDQQSLIRLMVYTNEFEIEALIASASGTRGELKQAVTRPDLIREIIHAYGQVRPNLLRHAAGWPEEEQLLRCVKPGNPQRGDKHIGEGHDTEGSRFLVERIDAGTPQRSLNIAIWGGQTDLAQALWRVKHERGEAGFRQFAEKFRVFDISDQDGIAEWMRAEFPGMHYILAKAPPGQDKRQGTYRGMYLTGDESLTSREWVERHVSSTGPLGAIYPMKTWTAPNKHGCLKEGDTPSWFFFLPIGGNDPADPAKPGWGGQYERQPDGWYRDLPAKPGFDPRETVSRWRPDFQRDFARRMAWCSPAPTLSVEVVPAPGPIWKRHTIDNTSKGADGVKLGDINADGLQDIVTGWEEGGEVRLYLNPGPDKARHAWPRVTVGKVSNVEEAILADLDGDGRLDVVSGTEGKTRTVYWHRFTGTDADLTSSERWSTEAFPATRGSQAWMQAAAMDLDGQYGLDLMLGSKNAGATVGWLQSPPSPRDLAGWQFHTLRQSGWVMSLIPHDMDEDGDLDVVISDRKGPRTGVFWLENPGVERNREHAPWKEHAIGVLGREVMFADVADFDGDGLVDVAVAVKPVDIVLCMQEARGIWRKATLKLDSANLGDAKAVKVADLNRDGLPDLLFTCENAKGQREGIVWLERQRNGPWLQRPLGGPEGLKYDLMQVLDLDGDGDLDLITCEERDQLGVVWYENPHAGGKEEILPFGGEVLVSASSEFARNSEASMVQTGEGNLLLFYGAHTTAADWNPAVIRQMHSFDGGRTWSQPVTMLQDVQRSLFQPSLARLANGDLGLTYTSLSTGKEKDAYKLFRRSTDEGRTWSSPVKISDDSFSYTTGPHDRLYVLASGRLLALLHCNLQQHLTRQGGPHGFYVVYSDDHGSTWRRTPHDRVLDVPANPENHLEWGAWEPSLVEHAPGHLLLMMRTATGWFWECKSEDSGATWSAPVQSLVENPLAPPVLTRVPGTDILVLLHNPQVNVTDTGRMAKLVGGTRQVLAYRTSRDAGRTWSAPTPVAASRDGKHWFDYPAVLWVGDCLHVAVRRIEFVDDKFSNSRISLMHLTIPKQTFVERIPQ